MEAIGWVGTALVIIAYYPQIHHLFVEKCAWGISRLTWLIWLVSSALLLIYCILRAEVLLCFVQGVNILAIATTLILVRRSNRICPFHRMVAETAMQGENNSQLKRASGSVSYLITARTTIGHTNVGC